MGGTPEDAITKIPCYLALYRDLGWQAGAVYLDADEMHRRLLPACKDEHAREQAQLEDASREHGTVFAGTPWSDEMCPVLDSKKRYVWGFSLSPPKTREVYNKVFPVTASDFAHCYRSSRNNHYPGVSGNQCPRGGGGDDAAPCVLGNGRTARTFSKQ